jgi:hypothetical protein
MIGRFISFGFFFFAFSWLDVSTSHNGLANGQFQQPSAFS